MPMQKCSERYLARMAGLACPLDTPMTDDELFFLYSTLRKFTGNVSGNQLDTMMQAENVVLHQVQAQISPAYFKEKAAS